MDDLEQADGKFQYVSLTPERLRANLFQTLPENYCPSPWKGSTVPPLLSPLLDLRRL